LVDDISKLWTMRLSSRTIRALDTGVLPHQLHGRVLVKWVTLWRIQGQEAVLLQH
jgi:hypothetical protein